MSNITIMNETYPCPPFVFKLPITQSFKIPNNIHETIFTRLNVSHTVEPLSLKHFNSSFYDEDFENQMELVKMIQQLNQKLEDTLNKTNKSARFGTESRPRNNLIWIKGIFDFKLEYDCIVTNDGIDDVREETDCTELTCDLNCPEMKKD